MVTGPHVYTIDYIIDIEEEEHNGSVPSHRFILQFTFLLIQLTESKIFEFSCLFVFSHD